MYVFLENNNNLKNNLEKIKKLNYIPIILYKLNIGDKEKTKQNIQNLITQKNKENFKFSGIQINIIKQNNQISNIINELKKEFNIIIGLGGLNKTNIFFIEQTKIDFLQDPQNSNQKPKIDYIHHFNSGLNQILLKQLNEKQIKILITFNFFEISNKYKIAKEIGRINQNIKFTNKYKIPIYLNFIIKNNEHIKSLEEINSIIKTFEISTKQIKQNQTILEKTIIQNEKIRSQNYITNKLTILQ